MTRRGLGYAVYFLPLSLVGSVSPIVSAYAINMWGIWFLFPFAISMFIIALTILQLMPVREAYRDRRQKPTITVKPPRSNDSSH